MNTRLLTLFAIGMSGLFVLSYPHENSAFATQCAGRNIQGNFDLADSVFLGNVTSVQYSPFSDTAKVTFDVQHVFKGKVGEKIAIHYDLKQMFNERIAFANGTSYVVLPEEKNSQYHVGFCTPVYHGVLTVVDGFYDLENGNNTTFGNLLLWNLSEKMLPKEIKTVEETQNMAFAMTQQNIDEIKQLEKDIIFVTGILLISAIVGGIIATVVIVWRKRK